MITIPLWLWVVLCACAGWVIMDIVKGWRDR